MTDAAEMNVIGWGDPAEAGPVPEATRELVEAVWGISPRPALDEVKLPPSRLSSAELESLAGVVGADHVLTCDAVRRLRTRGKSTPDLLKQREGDLRDAPDAVVRPGGHDEVAAVLGWAVEHDVAVVPFGGGTSVVGGLNAERGSHVAVISCDLVRMKRLVAVDHESMTATLEPGLRGPEAEALLAAEGLTLGHFPQSFEYASIGGFAATRSSGQSSAGYGRFDAMVVGLRMATPVGEWRLGSSPANAAGPDLRQLVLGSEGTLGVITEVVVRVRPQPEVKQYTGWLWPSWEAGSAAMRRIAQGGLLPTVLRLSDDVETATNHPGEHPAGTCRMVVGYEGTAESVALRRTAIEKALTALGGTPLGQGPGDAWAANRFKGPYIRDGLLDIGVLVDTVETATFWSNIPSLYTEVRNALAESIRGAIVMCHISHVYETGCSLYFTVLAKAAEDAVTQWYDAKAAASDAISRCQAACTHHHAVGVDHRPWLVDEIGELGVAVLRSVKASLDPTGIMNPGVLVG